MNKQSRECKMQALKVGLKREKIMLGKGCWQSEDGRMVGESEEKQSVIYRTRRGEEYKQFGREDRETRRVYRRTKWKERRRITH